MSWYWDFESFVRERVPLAPLTTYRVGGPAELFASPPDSEALGALLRRAADAEIRVHLLGHGTNLLVGDEGVDGMVVRLPKAGFGFLQRDGLRLHVGAGHSLPALVKWSVAQGLRGLECLQGVPGTVGAALRMNAGGKHGEICATVRRAHGVELDGTPFDFSTAQCGFTYRSSGLSGRIVTDCELELQPGDEAAGRELLISILNEKCASQPVSARSAGCVFKNPPKPLPPAGKLIDDLGLKGFRVGGASISALHANFLVCDGEAKAADLAQLIRLIRGRVRDTYGIELELEVEVWGIEGDALMPQRAA